MPNAENPDNLKSHDSNEHKILSIGTILTVDDEGYLVSQSSQEKIIPPWDVVVGGIRDKYVEELGDKLQSLYMRGSVGRGNAIEGVSDIDGLAVVYGNPKNIDWSWVEDFASQATEKYPFVAGVDMMQQSYEAILSGDKKIAAFLVKTMSACVYGEDLGPRLPSVKPGRDAVVACWNIESKVSPEYLAKNSTITSAQKMRWVSKQILRAGFELVMEQEQAFTRDLYPCYELFSKHYPDKEPVMRRALEMALWPTNDDEALRGLLNDIGPWLIEVVQKKFPRQDAALLGDA